MSTADCNSFLEQLDQWMEGERSPATEAHIRTCAECNNLIADLNSIHETASTLDAVDPGLPRECGPLFARSSRMKG